MYAVNEGVEWMILTNGQVWQVWHLTSGLPVVVDLALEIDLLSDATAVQKTDALFHLSCRAASPGCKPRSPGLRVGLAVWRPPDAS